MKPPVRNATFVRAFAVRFASVFANGRKSIKAHRPEESISFLGDPRLSRESNIAASAPRRRARVSYSPHSCKTATASYGVNQLRARSRCSRANWGGKGFRWRVGAAAASTAAQAPEVHFIARDRFPQDQENQWTRVALPSNSQRLSTQDAVFRTPRSPGEGGVGGTEVEIVAVRQGGG